MNAGQGQRSNFGGKDYPDEIDLIGLARMLWQARIQILVIMLACVAAAAVFVFFILTPRYEASVSLAEPLPASLSRLNAGRQPVKEDAEASQVNGLRSYTPEEVYDYVLRFIGSDEIYDQQLRHVLGRTDTDALSPEEVYENRWRIKISNDGRGDKRLYRISVYGYDRNSARENLVHYVEQLRRKAVGTFLQDAGNESVGSLRRMIEENRAVSGLRLQDRIVRLEDALRIARAVGMQQPQLGVARVPAEASLSAYLDGSELYARGALALEAELKILRERANDDSYADGLREHQVRLHALESSRMREFTDLVPYRMEGGISVSAAPVGPKKIVVLILAAIMGAMIGMLIALLRQAFSRSSHAA